MHESRVGCESERRTTQEFERNTTHWAVSVLAAAPQGMCQIAAFCPVGPQISLRTLRLHTQFPLCFDFFAFAGSRTTALEPLLYASPVQNVATRQLCSWPVSSLEAILADSTAGALFAGHGRGACGEFMRHRNDSTHTQSHGDSGLKWHLVCLGRKRVLVTGSLADLLPVVMVDGQSTLRLWDVVLLVVKFDFLSICETNMHGSRVCLMSLQHSKIRV